MGLIDCSTNQTTKEEPINFYEVSKFKNIIENKKHLEELLRSG